MTGDVMGDAQRRFARLIVPHKSYTQAMGTLEHAIIAAHTTSEPVSGLMTGEPGTGKTTICQILVSRRPPVETRVEERGIRRVIPAFYCAVPAEVSIKGLASEMLNRLGCAEMRGDRIALERRLFALLGTCRTEVIFLDEFHHLLARGAEKTRAGVCDWVKGLMNKTGIPVVLVGMPQCEAIINEHPQLARRFPYRAHLQAIPYASGAHSEFVRVLKAFRKGMVEYAGMRVVVAFTDGALAAMLYVATAGNMNAIRQLLYEVVGVALHRGNNEVVAEDFAQAFAAVRLDSCLVRGRNPFTLDSAAVRAIIANVPAC